MSDCTCDGEECSYCFYKRKEREEVEKLQEKFNKLIKVLLEKGYLHEGWDL